MKKLKIKWEYFLLVALTIITLSYFPTFAKDNPSQNEVYKQEIKVSQLIKTKATSIDQPIDFSKLKAPEVTALKVDIPVGKETGWHKHPFHGYAYILQGVLTLDIKDGESQVNKQLRYEAGSTLIEVLNTAHNGRNLGNEPVSLIVFFTAETGKPFTVPAI